MSAQIVICCGSGGVGKTTVSAALALKWALEGRRVAVLTIDPARRLADSLGIGEIGNQPRRVPVERVDPDCAGSLEAVMLDAKATFDDLVRRTAPDAAAAERILSNHYYKFTSTRLGGSHEYMAMERLYELWESGRYDVVILDTPPTRHALDFLRAPDRLVSLMDEGVLRWLVMPTSRSGWRALELGSEAVARVLRKLVGRGTIGEIAEFFEAFRDLWEGIRARSVEVRGLLRDRGTRFVLVTSPAPGAREEALYFLDLLAKSGMPFGGFLVNRTVLPSEHPLDPARLPAEGPLPPDRWRAVLEVVARVPAMRAEIARDHIRSVDQLRAAGPPGAPCWRLPDRDRDLHDLTDLAELAPWLPDAV